MNPIAEEILMHYGMPRRSGRYPWGSGDTPYQHSKDFITRIGELRKEGHSETKIAELIGVRNTGELRTLISIAKQEERAIEVGTAKALREKGYTLNEIAAQMGYKNDSSIRSLLNEDSEARMNEARVTFDVLKKNVDEKGMIEVGAGVEHELGISKEKLNQALYMLEMEGYEIYGGGVPQVTNPGKQTNLKVLCVPGTEHKEIYNFENVHSIENYYSHDRGESFDTFKYPKSMDSNRIEVRYLEDGGGDKDGVVEIRRGVKDISLGDAHYAQVRILVDKDKYIKGMAVYSDNLPEGVDMVFNTNKSSDIPKDKVFKPITNDPENPFGALIKVNGQSYYIDDKGKRQMSLINKTSEEGDWDDWSDKLPSQFLSKQNKTMINKQLNLTIRDKEAEFEEIRSYTNPTVKKHLLQSFSDDCDAAAVHLKAASLPRQKYKVILPVNSLKDDEVYAPTYENGEKVALVRFPHGGTFEIPILTVNNKHKPAEKMIGNTSADAIGINKKVADRLSGADFDGDTVMVIPTGGKVKITSTPPLKNLEGFDPKMSYPSIKGMKVMKNTQTEMGKISNLITDMTLKGATESELARAVRHSMVVIDAEKHGLNYKQSEIDNCIKALKEKYQGRYSNAGRYSEGASTLISRAKSQEPKLKVTGSPKINTKDKAWYDPTRPEGALLYNRVANKADKDWYDPTRPEGAYIYKPAETYVDKTGKVKTRTQTSTKMAETDDAFTLVSDANTQSERAYADYANKMKAMANQARKEMVTTGKIEYSPSAKQTYLPEVKSLLSKLNVALKNAPRERKAQLLANAHIKEKLRGIEERVPPNTLKKQKQQALTYYRVQVGAKREPIKISDREWEAIQAGAISETKLKQIIQNSDLDAIKQRAMPRATTVLSAAKIAKLLAMDSTGYTTKEIAESLNVSTNVINNYLYKKD